MIMYKTSQTELKISNFSYLTCKKIQLFKLKILLFLTNCLNLMDLSSLNYKISSILITFINLVKKLIVSKEILMKNISSMKNNPLLLMILKMMLILFKNLSRLKYHSMRMTFWLIPKKINHSNKLYNPLRKNLIILKKISRKKLRIYKKDSKKKRLRVKFSQVIKKERSNPFSIRLINWILIMRKKSKTLIKYLLRTKLNLTYKVKTSARKKKKSENSRKILLKKTQ